MIIVTIDLISLRNLQEAMMCLLTQKQKATVDLSTTKLHSEQCVRVSVCMLCMYDFV